MTRLGKRDDTAMNINQDREQDEYGSAQIRAEQHPAALSRTIASQTRSTRPTHAECENAGPRRYSSQSQQNLMPGLTTHPRDL